MSQRKHNGIGISRRANAGLTSTVDVETRSFPIVITTEHPVRTWIPNPAVAKLTAAEIEITDISWIEVDEVLLTEGMDFSRTPRMPLLDSHDSYGIEKILGRVDDVRIDGKTVVGLAVLTNERKALLTDISEGFYGQVSAGYCVQEYELTEREGFVPLATAVKWTLHEASLVAVGADPNATVRGKREFPMPTYRQRAADSNTQTQETTPMELDALVAAAEEAIDAVVAATDEGASEEVAARAAKLRALRADGDVAADPEKKTEDAAAVEAARADEAAADAELTPAEQKEVEVARSIAKPYGPDALKLVNDLASLRSRPSKIRAALRSLISSGATASEKDGFEPNKARAAAPKSDLRSIYKNLNSRAGSGK